MSDRSKVTLPGIGAEPSLPGMVGPPPQSPPPRQGPKRRGVVIAVVAILAVAGAFMALGSSEEADRATSPNPEVQEDVGGGEATPAVRGAIRPGVYVAMPPDFTSGGNNGTGIEFEVKRDGDQLKIPFVAAFGMEPTDCGNGPSPSEDGEGITFLDDEPKSQRSRRDGAELTATWVGPIELEIERGSGGRVAGSVTFAFEDMRPGCTGVATFTAKRRGAGEGRPFFDQITAAGG